MATVKPPAPKWVNEVWVAPAFEVVVVDHLKPDLLDPAKRKVESATVKLWLKNPDAAVSVLTSRVGQTYGTGHDFGDWPKPGLSLPKYEQIYWAIIRLMERDPQWSDSVGPFKIEPQRFDSVGGEKRVWFG